METTKKFAKRISIREKIIYAEDIKVLADFITKKEENSCTYTLYCDNGEIITSDDVSLFEEPEFKRRLIVKITMTAFNLKTHSSIIISLDTESMLGNYVEIESTNCKDYNSDCNKINEIIDSIPDQNKVIAKFRGFLNTRIISTLLLVFPGMFMLLSTMLDKTICTGHCGLGWIILSGFIVLNIEKLLIEMYPYIEFAFLREHNNKAAQKRKLALNVLLLIVIPPVAQRLTDWLFQKANVLIYLLNNI